MSETAGGMSPADKIRAAMAELGLTIESVFIPFSQSRNKNKRTEYGNAPCLNWRITLKRDGREILTTDYSAGPGHCPGYKAHDRSKSQRELIEWECEHGRAGWITGGGTIFNGADRRTVMPDACDVINALVLDAEVLDHGGFEAWARDFGYDIDSRKAEATWKQCLDTALKLIAGIDYTGLRKLRDAMQDY